MPPVRLLLLPTLAALALAATSGCGTSDTATRTKPIPGALADGRVPSTPDAVPVGSGDALRPTAGLQPQQPARFPCLGGRAFTPHDAVHLELFARGRVVIVPAGIGVASPRTTDGAFVTGGACTTTIRTSEPTGVIELTPGTRATLGGLFAIWGRALAPTRLLSFDGRVRAWVDGRRQTGPPQDIPLTHHAQIVVVIGPSVPVHATYGFPPAGVTHLRP